MNKKEMIKIITDARHSDIDFFYCIVSVNDINDLSDNALNKMTKKELNKYFVDANEILLKQSLECGEVPQEFKN